ncbi:hypothetical protein QFZ58_006570 [Streptomyces sp. B1I3]|nr:hypothetical protein [Streptomyces sp. B1I3]
MGLRAARAGSSLRAEDQSFGRAASGTTVTIRSPSGSLRPVRYARSTASRRAVALFAEEGVTIITGSPVRSVCSTARATITSEARVLTVRVAGLPIRSSRTSLVRPTVPSSAKWGPATAKNSLKEDEGAGSSKGGVNSELDRELRPTWLRARRSRSSYFVRTSPR